MKTKYFEKTLIAGLLMTSASAFAVPFLQIGAGGTASSPGGVPTDPNWAYSGGTPDTWVNSGDGVFKLDLTAKPTAFFSDTAPKIAYLVVAALPQASTGVFGVTLTGDSNTGFTLYESGYGIPPSTDDLPTHGIYQTYYQIYEFEFNNAQTTIFNTTPSLLPGDSEGSTSGFLESVEVTINSLGQGNTGIHFDLFTLYDDVQPGGGSNGGSITVDQIYKNAPFSHDAEWSGTLNPPDPDPDQIPEPTALWMLGLGLLGLAGFKRKQAKLAA